MIALYWQEHVVGGFHDAYFSSKSLYAANKMVPSLDNMDQVSQQPVTVSLWLGSLEAQSLVCLDPIVHVCSASRMTLGTSLLEWRTYVSAIWNWVLGCSSMYWPQ